MPKVPKITSLQYLKKGGREEADLLQINIKLSHQLVVLILVSMASHTQFTQNNNLIEFLPYIKICRCFN